LDRDKNLEILIHSFIKSKASQKTKLIIAGKGTETKTLINIAQKYPTGRNIKFLGFVPEKKVVPLYQNALAYLITSKVEAQSITTLQAIACGIPIIVAKAGALPELIHHQKNGFLVPPDNIKATAGAIDQLASLSSSRWKQFSKASLSTAKNHNIKKTFQKYEKLFQETINR